MCVTDCALLFFAYTDIDGSTVYRAMGWFVLVFLGQYGHHEVLF